MCGACVRARARACVKKREAKEEVGPCAEGCMGAVYVAAADGNAPRLPSASFCFFALTTSTSVQLKIING